MTSALYPQSFIFRAFTQSGTLAPLAGGLLYFYQAGTTTLQAAYSDPTGATPLSNPLVLDSNGVASFCLLSGLNYKITLTDSLGVVQDGYPVDNITADVTTLVGASRYAVDTGVANAYVVALSPVVTSNYNGLRVTFKALHTNTGASTLDVGAGATPIKTNGGLPLPAGAISAGSVYDVIYDSATSSFWFTYGMQSLAYAVDTGTANAYAISVVSANVPGEVVAFKALNTNTGASTLNAGGGIASLVNNAGGALAANDILAGSIYSAIYDGATSKWWLQNIIKSQLVNNLNAFYNSLSGSVTSTIGVMGGFNSGKTTFTPNKSGTCIVSISGQLQSGGAGIATLTPHYGTGTPPLNGAASTGSSPASLPYTYFTFSAAGLISYSMTFVVTGLTLGTAYWFDHVVKVTSGGISLSSADNHIFTILEM